MRLDGWLPGLTVEDADGTRLPYLPRREIVERLETLDGDQGEEILHAALGGKKLLWIILPEEIEPGEDIVLVLRYDDPHFPGYSNSLVRAPIFPVSEDKTNESHDTFVEITAPPTTRALVQERAGFAEDPPGIDQPDEPGELDLVQFYQVRFPKESQEYSFEYRTKPPRSDVVFIWGSFIIWSSIPLLLLAWAQWGSLALDTPPIPAGEAVGTAGVLGTLALLSIKPDWVNRIWLLVPLLLYLVLLTRTFI